MSCMFHIQSNNIDPLTKEGDSGRGGIPQTRPVLVVVPRVVSELPERLELDLCLLRQTLRKSTRHQSTPRTIHHQGRLTTQVWCSLAIVDESRAARIDRGVL